MTGQPGGHASHLQRFDAVAISLALCVDRDADDALVRQLVKRDDTHRERALSRQDGTWIFDDPSGRWTWDE
jgi:hypothetical protein